MPKVGGKHFAYSKEGYREAKQYAKKTGKKLQAPRDALRKAAAARLNGAPGRRRKKTTESS